MSIPALALLIAVTMALRSATAGWARVLMAPLDPIADALTSPLATIAVTIGDERTKVRGRALLDGERTIELIVQVVLPAELTVTSGSVLTPLDTRGVGGKIALAAAWRAIETILQVDRTNVWSGLLGSLIISFPDDVETRPFLIESEKGAKLSAVEFALPCSVLESPEIGAAPSYFWSDLVGQLRSAPELESAADLIEALIAGDALPDWRGLQAILGHGDRTMLSLGLGPVLSLDDVYAADVLTVAHERGAAVVETGTPP